MYQKKKQILFILHYPPPVHGSSIVGSFIKQSASINERFNADYINLSTSSKIAEIGGYNIQKILIVIKLFWKIIYLNIKKKYDICYVAIAINGKAFYRDLLVVFLLRIFNRKIVLHLHNKGASSFSNTLRKISYKYVFNNTKVILLSGLLFSDIEKYVKKEQIYICPNGIPDNHRLTINKKSNDEILNILFLSNIMIEKGVLILLESCVKLKERGQKFLCHFVGGWKDLSPMKSEELINQKGLKNLVFFHGPKYDVDKSEILANADIFIFPTYYKQECFPLVLLEAMQYSLPVISTFEGGIPEMVVDTETGFLCPQKDVDCLVQKMELLINNSELRARMGEAGRKRFVENFTLNHFEKRFTDIIENIVNE